MFTKPIRYLSSGPAGRPEIGIEAAPGISKLFAGFAEQLDCLRTVGSRKKRRLSMRQQLATVSSAAECNGAAIKGDLFRSGEWTSP